MSLELELLRRLFIECVLVRDSANARTDVHRMREWMRLPERVRDAVIEAATYYAERGLEPR